MQGSGFRVQGSGCRVHGAGFMVQDAGCSRTWAFGIRNLKGQAPLTRLREKNLKSIVEFYYIRVHETKHHRCVMSLPERLGKFVPRSLVIGFWNFI